MKTRAKSGSGKWEIGSRVLVSLLFLLPTSYFLLPGALRAQLPNFPQINLGAINERTVYALGQPGATTADKVNKAIQVTVPPATIVIDAKMSGTSGDFSNITLSSDQIVIEDRRGGNIIYGYRNADNTVSARAFISQSGQSVLSLNNIRFADDFPGADWAAKVTAADAILGASFGEIWLNNNAGTSAPAAAPILSTGHILRIIQGGTYNLGSNVLVIPSQGGIIGPGRGAATLLSTSVGDSLLINGKNKTILKGFTLQTNPVGAAVVGIHYTAATPQTCVFNRAEDIEVLGVTPIVAGQIGILMDGNSCVFNSFESVLVDGFDQPIRITGSSEGNIWSDVQISFYGATNGAAGIFAGGGNDQFYGARFSIGSGTANPIYGFNLAGDGNVAFGHADIGANGQLFTGAGASNFAWGTVIGATSSGSLTGQYNLFLGRTRTGSLFEVNANASTGANHSLFASQVSSFSNGFMVDYQDALPRAMRYTFLDGAVGIGASPAFSPTPSLTVSGNTTTTTLSTSTNCASAASPAACGSASAGHFVIAAGATSVVVNTTAVTANSQIFIDEDQSAGTRLGVTCNTGISSLPVVSARTAGTSFTALISASLATNPVCYAYQIIN